MTSLLGRLLGFDLRRHPEDYVPVFWNEARRQRYLLAPKLSEIFSVDRFVWPSVFGFSSKVSDLEPINSLKTIPVVSEYRESGLWVDQNQMRVCYDSVSEEARARAIEIAVVLVAEPIPSSAEFGSALLERDVVPFELPPLSSILGYDVADAGLMSGLSNCSYLPDEKNTLLANWSGRLNSCGLFRDLQDALKFKDLTDKRVHDHAPFWIFRLHRLS